MVHDFSLLHGDFPRLSLRIRLSYFIHEYSSRYEKMSSVLQRRDILLVVQREVWRGPLMLPVRGKSLRPTDISAKSQLQTLSNSSHSAHMVLIWKLFFLYCSESPLRMCYGILPWRISMHSHYEFATSLASPRKKTAREARLVCFIHSKRPIKLSTFPQN